jgi:hypothetical protein
MSNQLATTNVVAKEALAILQNSLAFAKNCNRDYQDEFGGNMSRGYAPGQTINIKRPPRYTYREGRIAVPQSTVETTVPLTVFQGGTDINFTSFEKTLSVVQFERKMRAAMASVVNEIERKGLDLARRTVGNLVGTPGSLPTTQAAAYALLTQAPQKLQEMGAPIGDGGMNLIVNPAMNGAILQGFAGLFNNQSVLSKGMQTGLVQGVFDFGVKLGQNVARHQNGTQAAGTATVNGAGQVGSNLIVGALAGTLTQGTVFTIAGVNAVNPQSRQDNNALQQFVVTANVAAGATSVPIYPAITATGALQTVTASPANAAAITIVGAANAGYDANILFHRDAFTLACVPMDEPEAGMGAKTTQMSDDGFTIKVTKVYDGVNDNNLMRLDVLYGYAATYPELACKVIA